MRGAVARSLRQAVVYRLAGTSALRHLARVTGAAGRMGAMSDIDGMGTERAHCVLAPNPSPMTLDGTNTWILAEPGSEQAIVVDPGPKDGEHLRRVADTVAAQGRRVGLVLLTHGHPDHAAGAGKFAGLAGGPAVRALDPRHRLGDEGLAEGEVVTLGGLEVRVLETPGHSDDSLSFWIPADSAILTGDTVLGYGTTVVEGSLGDYLDSLERLREFAGEEGARTILPGHGPKLDDPTGALDHYLRHRRDRLAQVEAAMAAGARTAREVVERVYADVDRSLWPAAEWSVRAQLDYLRERGGTGG
ncbi:MBL fold metallo-hydrolase [Actinomadura scrupuli]|uniref:MBL fold metallo-hydrolase n=1 Tax=Actinomadura scrupuli TaxID=559629 RepID=UPI003D96A9F5